MGFRFCPTVKEEMLTKRVQYKDYNGNDQNEELYFNLTRMELASMLDMQDTLDKWVKRVDASKTQKLSNDDIIEMLDIIKRIVRVTYGVRSEDGKRFLKNQDIYEAFEQSAAYDEFIFSLFQDNGQGASDFMTQLMPAGLLPEEPTATVELPQPEGPAYLHENRDPTKEELMTMSQDELKEAFLRRTSQ